MCDIFPTTCPPPSPVSLPLDADVSDPPRAPNYGINFNLSNDYLKNLSDTDSSLSELLTQPGKERCRPFQAVVNDEGFASLQLNCNINVDIAPNQAIRISNPKQETTLCLSGCGTQMAMTHPRGHLVQYGSQIEVQTIDANSIKHAKIEPRGVSFRSSRGSLVYLIDETGCRSIEAGFHDLFNGNIANIMFKCNTMSLQSPHEAVDKCNSFLQKAKYWRTNTDMDCWIVNDIYITQTMDGLLSVERKQGREVFSMRTSPNNGKVKVQSSFFYVTASLGFDAHVFVKTNNRRLHCNGKSFTVRNAGYSAGYDANGLLRFW